MMWEQGLNASQGGGGFYGDNQSTPSTGEKRRQRAQNLVPVRIQDILESRDEQFQVEGMEVGMVTFCGVIDGVDHQSTKSIYRIRDDDSGNIEVMQWKDENAQSNDHLDEGEFVRIVGSVRSQGEKKNVMSFRVQRIANEEEMDAHSLEVVYARLKIRQLHEKENNRIGANSNFGGNTSMAGGIGYGSTQVSSAFSTQHGGGNSSTVSNVALVPGLTPNQDVVYRMVRGCLQEEGVNRDVIFDQVSARMTRKEMDNVLDILCNEGHIYTTTDDNHFKCTDA